MRWDSWNELSKIPWDLSNRGSGIKSFGKSFVIDGDRKRRHRHRHTHTCHPWSLDCCRTDRHLSSGDSFFLSPKVGTTRSLYLRKKNREDQS